MARGRWPGWTPRRGIILTPSFSRCVPRGSPRCWAATRAGWRARSRSTRRGSRASADWDTSALFTQAERAHLAFTEQFVTSVRDISDRDVDALLEHGSAEQVHSFVAALYAVEMEQRVDLVGSIVLTTKE